ncbi:MAG: precorrin-6A reductase [Thermoplasmatales archaeon]|nr:precorrin-6A reductase [Thermoplasmatales archaeon]
MAKKVLVFAGTADGRKAAAELVSAGADVTVSVATEYGLSTLKLPGARVIHGGLGGPKGISDYLMKNGIDAVLDATHPYARKISASIAEACSSSKVPMVRMLREAGDWDGMTVVPDVPSAVEYLKGTEGNVLVTTGSKELSEYVALENFADRVYARVLPLPDVVSKCLELGFRGKNLICAQGPHTEEMNAATLGQVSARYLVTKDSGAEGGFQEKISAAARMGAEIVLIARPPEGRGLPYGKAVTEILSILGLEARRPSRLVHVIGIGTGGDGMTLSALAACEESDVLIGAKRMVESVPVKGKSTFTEYRAEKVIEYLLEHPEYGTAAVLFSGDIGFHSGAKKLLESIPADWAVETHPGIASPVYLCSKLGIPWEDAKLVSAHWKDCNATGEIAANGKTFLLLDGHAGFEGLASDLKKMNLGHVVLHVGIDLGGHDERIVSGTASDMPDASGGSLYCALALNDKPRAVVSAASIPDASFQRGGAPMTKAEVRSICVAKLGLSRDSVVYDVGAGTGSVSIEMALAALSGKVYAFEKDPESANLIRANAERFALSNVEVVEGSAPESFSGLPTPTHAFVGGSSGNMGAIMDSLLGMDPGMPIVVTAVTLETMAETLAYVKSKDLAHEVSHISVAKARKVGDYSMMTCSNPIYVISVNSKVGE